jgi:hypothetical protein
MARPLISYPAKPTLYLMRNTILSAIVLTMLAAPALAETGYPVSGKWGQSNSTEKGAIDCGKLRVIDFQGETRTDSQGGVPAYRNKSITAEGQSRYRVVDEFTTGQIRNGSTSYKLSQSDADHLEMAQQQGGTIKLRRCK